MHEDVHKVLGPVRARERRWFVLERPRRDINGGSETAVTLTSKLQANAERNKEIEKRQKREEKAASFGGAVRGSERTKKTLVARNFIRRTQPRTGAAQAT